MMEHILKTDSDVFELVITGKKTYEIRYNDRDFKIGDTLLLCETLYNGADMKQGKPLQYTGKKYRAIISHVLTGPLYGLENGWAILSLSNSKYDTLGRLALQVIKNSEDCSTSGICNDIENWDEDCINKLGCEWSVFCKLRKNVPLIGLGQLIDFEEHELEKIRGDASGHIMSQKAEEYTIWNKIADKIDEVLGVENE